MTTTEGMKGGGYYDDHSEYQRSVYEYFARLTARFAADPEADAFEDWTLTVVLTRR